MTNDAENIQIPVQLLGREGLALTLWNAAQEGVDDDTTWEQLKAKADAFPNADYLEILDEFYRQADAIRDLLFPTPHFTYDNGNSFALDVYLSDAGTWGFRSDSLNGVGAHAFIPKDEAIRLANLILDTYDE